MEQASREAGVVVSRRKLDNPWIDHSWSPVMVLTEAPNTAPWSRLPDDGGGADLFYAGAAHIDLFSTDTANYRDNLLSGAPRVWVALRILTAGAELELTNITVDPAEGEALFSAGADVIGAVPMPSDLAAWVAQFVDAFHVEHAFIKRKRDRPGGNQRRERRERGGGTG